MNEKPLVVKTFRNTEYQHREIDNSKILGAKVISPNRWLTEKKRIAETLENNKIYFTEANLDKYKLLKRGRESLVDIQPKMKYKFYSTLSRVTDAIKESMPLRELETGKHESRGSSSTSSQLPGYFKERRMSLPLSKKIQYLNTKSQVD